MSNIKVQLPDGSIKEVPQGSTALDVARSISPRLADAALVAKLAPIDSSNGDWRSRRPDEAD
jgi:threonyl-tRNA synthetase